MPPQEGWIPENPLFSLDLCVNFLLQTTEFVVQSQELMFFEGMRGVFDAEGFFGGSLSLLRGTGGAGLAVTGVGVWGDPRRAAFPVQAVMKQQIPAVSGRAALNVAWVG